MTSRLLLTFIAALFAPFALFAASDTTLSAGQSVTLSVTANGTTPFTYVWTKDGTPLSGATSASLAIPSFGAANAGVYQATVSNGFGSTLSDTAKLILQALIAPVITSQPVGGTIALGTKLGLAVTATGTPAVTYQWYKGSTPIPGATSATFSIAAASASDGGDYTVTVVNSAGSVTSTKATVLIGIPPSGAVLKVTPVDPVP